MEIAGTQNTRDDRTSVCRSFGSNYQPCSQSRKISIGVMVDSVAKSRMKGTNENEAFVPTIEKTSRNLSSIGDVKKREQAKVEYKVNQINQERNKMTHPRQRISEAVHDLKPTSHSPAGGNVFYKAAVETSANMQSNSDSLKKLNRVRGRMDEDVEEEREGTKGLPSATAQEISMPEDKATEVQDRRQVLKMKLWEILGADSSPNKQANQSPEVGGNNLHPEPDINQKHDAVVKPQQKSDPTKSDSPSPKCSTKRAVTRSSTRKKAVSRAPTIKTRNVRKSDSTKKSVEKNIVSFNEGQGGKAYSVLIDGSPKANEKSLGRKGSKPDTRRINLLEDPSAGEAQPEIDINKTSKGPEKTSSITNSMRSSQKSPPKNSSLFGPENGNKENSFSLLSDSIKGRKGSKRQASRFSFPEKLISDDVQLALDIKETIKGATKASSFGNRTRNSPSFPPRTSSRLIDVENGHQEKSSSLSSSTKRGWKGFTATNNAEKVQLVEDKIKPTKDVERDSSIGQRMRFCRTSPPERTNKLVDAENGYQEKDSSLSAAKKKLANISLHRNPHHWVQQEDFGTSPFKNKTNSHIEIQSPTFEFRTPVEAFSPGTSPKANNKDLDDQSLENYSFNSQVASKPDKYTPDAGIKTYNDEEEAEDSPLAKSGPTMVELESEDAGYKSSPEKMDSESSREGYKGWATEAMSPDFVTSENPEFGLYPNKRLRSQENFQSGRFSTKLASPEGLEDNDGSRVSPQTNEENGLADAISLLALALRRVETKIKTVTSKKSTEVLMSVAEEVHLQLKNVESQFERDTDKITSLNKSQRKHLETELEEQQEQLKVIYQKFKSDVNQHIQEQRSKVEVLQGQEKELRLFMGKRKASQKEVLKQLEKSIQSQLSDAETRISDVHKMGREKMLHLKQALGKCLKEGMLG